MSDPKFTPGCIVAAGSSVAAGNAHTTNPSVGADLPPPPADARAGSPRAPTLALSYNRPALSSRFSGLRIETRGEGPGRIADVLMGLRSLSLSFSVLKVFSKIQWFRGLPSPSLDNPNGLPMERSNVRTAHTGRARRDHRGFCVLRPSFSVPRRIIARPPGLLMKYE